MKTYNLIYLILIFFSCENNKVISHNFNEFPITSKANNKEIINTLETNLNARQLAIKDDYIYMFDYENRPYIRKYNRKFDIIDSLGLHNDFNIENPIFQHFDIDGNFVFINEGTFLSLYKKRLTDNNKNSLKLIDEIEINELFKADGIYQAFHFDDSFVVDAYYPKNGDVLFKHKKNEETKWLDFLFPIKENIDFQDENEFLHALYRNKLKVKPDNTKLVQVFSNFPSLQIINTEGERGVYKTYTNTNIKISSINEIHTNFLNNSVPTYVQYLNAFTSETKIYALFLNQSWEDILNYNYNSFEIHVFDWSLNPLQKIIINDQIDIMGSFVILEESDEIIFLNPNKEGHYYTKWKF
jgi:hypothetical protein